MKNLSSIYVGTSNADVEYEDGGNTHVATDEQLRGVVKKWDEAKGFGFIKPDTGVMDVFCHYSAVQSGRGHVTLREGQIVTFDLGPKTKGRADRGPRAINVRVQS
jgi:CspA family cold shock protein